MKATKNYQLTGSSKRIKLILSDINHYGRLHPLIQRVEKLEPVSQGTKYKIIERPYLWLPINIQYKVLVKTNEHEIDYEITEIPFTKAFINYQLNIASENLTNIQFHLTIKSKVFGKKILLNKMLDAQDQLMKAIQNELHSES